MVCGIRSFVVFVDVAALCIFFFVIGVVIAGVTVGVYDVFVSSAGIFDVEGDGVALAFDSFANVVLVCIMAVAL